MFKLERVFTDVKVVCNNGKSKEHKMLLAQVSDYFNTLFNTSVGSFNGTKTPLDCNVEALVFITDTIIYNVPKTITPELAIEVISLLDVLQVRNEFVVAVVSRFLALEIDFKEQDDTYSMYINFIMKFSHLITKEYITKNKLNKSEVFLRSILEHPNMSMFDDMSGTFSPEILLKIIKENPGIIVKMMTGGLSLVNVVNIITSQDEVEMFYKYIMKYIGSAYVKEKIICAYSKTYKALLEKNKLLGNNARIATVLITVRDL